MLAQSQGRNEQVVNSYNLFIDSAKDVGGAAGKGDSFSLQLGADSIQAQDGQFLRLTLQEFSMYDPPPSDFSGFRFTATLTVNEAVLFAV